MIGRILDFLFNLHRVHFGPGTRLGFVFDHVGLIAFLALVVAVLGYLSYVPQSASPNKKRVMGVLRGLLLAVVLVLACRPQLVMEREDRMRSVVAIWVDSSASMSLEDTYTGQNGDPQMQAYMEKVTQEMKGTGAPATNSSGRANRYELATATLEKAKWISELTKSANPTQDETQDVIFFTGSGRAEALGVASSPAEVAARIKQLKAGAPTGHSTDVPTVVRDIMDRVQGQRLSAIVLLTDGQTTEPGSRLDQAADAAQLAITKVFGVPVGQADEPFDLKITTMRVPESTFTRDPVSARLHIAATGITAAVPVRITVYRKKADGSIDASAPMATKEVTLDGTKKELDVDVPIRLKKTDPGKSERFDLVAKIEPIGVTGMVERTLANNEKSRTVTVLDAQINVLYVEGYPRWEYRYLKNELVREPTVNVATLLLTADEGYAQDADPPVRDPVTNEETFPGPLAHFPDTAQDLNKFDVLIIGDVEPTYFSPHQQTLIVDWVKSKGGGVCWLAGNKFNPETYRETGLEVLLPVVPDEIDPRARLMPPPDNVPFGVMLTPAGKDTNLFRFFDDADDSWKQVTNLPDLYWYKAVQGLKPGSIVLATNPKRAAGGGSGAGAPLLVVRQYGAGPVLFSAIGDTWRWRRYSGEPLFQSYWLQLCRLLYANKVLGASKRLELVSEASQVEIGTPIKLTLTVKDPTLSGQGNIPNEVPVLVVDKEGRTVQTIILSRPPTAVAATQGAAEGLDRLTGLATAGQLGEFSLQVKPGVLPVEVPAVMVNVEQPQREFESVTTDVASLQSLAKKTAGGVYTPVHFEEIGEKIPDRSLPVLNVQSEELWNKPIALVLVLLIATGEWLVRKSAGLI